MSHMNPLPFKYASKGELIEIKATDGTTVKAYKILSSSPSNNWLFVFHEWWGLNDYIKQRADELQKEFGVNVLAIDMYDGYVATDREKAAELMNGLKDERAKTIISTAFIYVGKTAKVCTIGWCMGGVMSVNAAIIGGGKCLGCVSYYGLPDLTSSEKLKNIKAPVLGLFAKQDAWISPKVVEDFEAKMKEQNKNMRSVFYDADHAFANPSNPKYNSEATQQANAEASAFLKSKFGLK
jgi:carboxymethylenebutenolidase